MNKKDKRHWVSLALCKGQTDTFFPNEEESRGKAFVMYREAKKICAECPVRLECLQYALDEGIFFGVFGGKTPKERKNIFRERLYAR